LVMEGRNNAYPSGGPVLGVEKEPKGNKKGRFAGVLKTGRLI